MGRLILNGKIHWMLKPSLKQKEISDMSEMIKCDECGKLLYTDSREEKGAYVSMNANDPLYGYLSFHLCRECYSAKFPWLCDEDDE